jgi:hypothetical protein
MRKFNTRFKQERQELAPDIFAENFEQAKLLFKNLKQKYPDLELLGEVAESNEKESKNYKLLFD